MSKNMFIQFNCGNTFEEYYYRNQSKAITNNDKNEDEKDEYNIFDKFDKVGLIFEGIDFSKNEYI